jgi:hypothetical protein
MHPARQGAIKMAPPSGADIKQLVSAEKKLKSIYADIGPDSDPAQVKAYILHLQEQEELAARESESSPFQSFSRSLSTQAAAQNHGAPQQQQPSAAPTEDPRAAAWEEWERTHPEEAQRRRDIQSGKVAPRPGEPKLVAQEYDDEDEDEKTESKKLPLQKKKEKSPVDADASASPPAAAPASVPAPAQENPEVALLKAKIQKMEFASAWGKLTERIPGKFDTQKEVYWQLYQSNPEATETALTELYNANRPHRKVKSRARDEDETPAEDAEEQEEKPAADEEEETSKGKKKKAAKKDGASPAEDEDDGMRRQVASDQSMFKQFQEFFRSQNRQPGAAQAEATAKANSQPPGGPPAVSVAAAKERKTHVQAANEKIDSVLAAAPQLEYRLQTEGLSDLYVYAAETGLEAKAPKGDFLKRRAGYADDPMAPHLNSCPILFDGGFEGGRMRSTQLNNVRDPNAGPARVPGSMRLFRA